MKVFLFLTIALFSVTGVSRVSYASSATYSSGGYDTARDLQYLTFDFASSPSLFVSTIPSIQELCSATEVPSIPDELSGTYPEPSTVVDSCFASKNNFVSCVALNSISLKPLISYFTGRGDKLSEFLITKLIEPVSGFSYFIKTSQNGIDTIGLNPYFGPVAFVSKVFLFKQIDTDLTLIALTRASQLLSYTAPASIGIPKAYPDPDFFSTITSDEREDTIIGLHILGSMFPAEFEQLTDVSGANEQHSTRGELCETNSIIQQEMAAPGVVIPSSLNACFNSIPGFLECYHAIIAAGGKNSLYLFFKSSISSFIAGLQSIGLVVMETSPGIYVVAIPHASGAGMVATATIMNTLGPVGFKVAMKNIVTLLGRQGY